VNKRAATIDDLAQIRIPSDPQIAPGGERIAFVVRTMDVDKNKYRAHIHLVEAAGVGTAASADGGEPGVRQLTHGDVSVAKPRWSPDGTRLAFTSERENKTEQIFVLPFADGGEAERVSDLPPGSIGQIAWSPDGTRIAFAFVPTTRSSAGKPRRSAKKPTDLRPHVRSRVCVIATREPAFCRAAPASTFTFSTLPRGASRRSRTAKIATTKRSAGRRTARASPLCATRRPTRTCCPMPVTCSSFRPKG
jgi:dipeptidyl aminopeptidase/acylaminoacyl peptidase